MKELALIKVGNLQMCEQSYVTVDRGGPTFAFFCQIMTEGVSYFIVLQMVISLLHTSLTSASEDS